MPWLTLDERAARRAGAECPEDVLRAVCEGCALAPTGQLDPLSCDCPTRAEYVLMGSAPDIQYDPVRLEPRCAGRI